MRLFVTGGTGFIGSHFLNQAHAAGHAILAHRRSPASVPRIGLESEPEWVEGSLDSLLPDTFEGCDCVVHLAAHSANVPYDTLERCLEENVVKPVRMIRAAHEAGVRRFIVAGSCFEYGQSGERYEFIPPDAPLEPTASYPASKAAASVALHALACELGLELVLLRIFQVYGEGELETRFWPSLRRAALAGEDFPMSAGDQVRDFIHVADVAAAFVASLSREDVSAGVPRVENLGSGQPQTLARFAEEQWRRFGATGELRLGEVPMRRHEVMRFAPRIP